MQNKQNETAGQPTTIDTLIGLTNSAIDKMLSQKNERDVKSARILKEILASAKR